MPWGAASSAWLCSQHLQVSDHLSLTASHEAEVSFSPLCRTGKRGKETELLPHGHTSELGPGPAKTGSEHLGSLPAASQFCLGQPA